MLNSNYKTSYFNDTNANMVSILASLYYSTVTCGISWSKSYDYRLSEYYYYAEDKEFKEKYYFYMNSPIVGNVLQIVSDKDKMNYEVDDSVYARDLGKLAGAIMNADKMKLPSKTNDGYKTYNYNNYGYDYNYGTYKPYKQQKLEKASKQLSEIEPLRNMEML